MLDAYVMMRRAGASPHIYIARDDDNVCVCVYVMMTMMMMMR